MALEVFTVRQALEGSNARLVSLETDSRLGPAQQAVVGELLQANDQALNALQANNTIPQGQRNGRAQQIEDKVFSNSIICRAHEITITIDEYYNALDLSMDAAGAIRLGLGSFTSDVVTT